MKDPSLFIPVHTGIWDHPKTRRLERRLQVSNVEAVGHLIALWTWAVNYAPDGDLSDLDDFEIGDAARWSAREQHDEFAQALRACGWLDGSILNDWENYAGGGLSERSHAKDRKRKQREKEAREKADREALAMSQPVTTHVTPGHAHVTPPVTHASHDVTLERELNGNGNGNGTQREPCDTVTAPPDEKPKSAGRWVKVKAGRQGGWQAGKPFTVEELLRQPEGQALALKFPQLDGKSDRPKLSSVLEMLWESFAGWTWPSPAVANLEVYVGRHARTHRAAWEKGGGLDIAAISTSSPPNGTGPPLFDDEVAPGVLR